MSNVSDLTIEVLRDIRSELRVMNGRIDDLNTRVETGLAAVEQRLEAGFGAVNQRLDSVLKIVGGHHTELDARVRRIEDHLGLPREH